MSGDSKSAPSAWKAATGDSFVEGLFGGARKGLFLTAHPVSGMKAKSICLSKGKASYDLDKKEIDIKDGAWNIKLNFDKSNVEMKNKLDADTTVNFGCNGVGKKDMKVYIGGVGSFGMATAQAKIFSDLNADVSAKASVSGLDCAGDMQFVGAGLTKALFGASYALPFGKKMSVGAVMRYPEMDSSVGLYGGATVPGTQSAKMGAELQLPAGKQPTALLGAELVIDKQMTIKSACSQNGLAHISFIQNFADVTLTAAVEADLLSGSANPSKFGCELKLK